MTYAFWSPTNNHSRFGVASGSCASRPNMVGMRDAKTPTMKQPAHFLSRASIDATSAFKSAEPLPEKRPLTARERALHYHDNRTGKYQPLIMDSKKRVPARPAFWAPDNAGARSLQSTSGEQHFIRGRARQTVRQEKQYTIESLLEKANAAESIQPKQWMSSVLSGRRGSLSAREKALAYENSRKRCFSR